LTRPFGAVGGEDAFRADDAAEEGLDEGVPVEVGGGLGLQCDAGGGDEDHGFREGVEVDVEQAAEVVILSHFGEHWLGVDVWRVALHCLADDFEVAEEHGVGWFWLDF